MVCDQCARKLSNLVTVDDRNKRIYGNLKVESSKKYSNGKYSMNECVKCKGRAEGKNEYCLTCAYKMGICEMCGKKLMNTKMYKYNDINNKDDKRKKKVMERSRLISEEIIKEKKLIKAAEKKEDNKNDNKEDLHNKTDSKEDLHNKDDSKEENKKQNEIKKKEFVPLINLDDNNNSKDSLKDEYDEIIYL